MPESKRETELIALLQRTSQLSYVARSGSTGARATSLHVRELADLQGELIRLLIEDIQTQSARATRRAELVAQLAAVEREHNRSGSAADAKAVTGLIRIVKEVLTEEL